MLIKKIVTPTGGASQTTNYLFGFEYENGVLSTFPHTEGYVKNNAGQYIYHYIYKDHLGNNRLVYADLDGNGTINPATEIVEENNYYPFGLKHEDYNDLPGDGYKYKFNGKEHEDALGLNIYEMDLRQYDPAIGRWVVQDPVVHHDYSPYSAFDNNPVYWSDPSGADATKIVDKDGNLVGAEFTGQDAIDAFNLLAGKSAQDMIEVEMQNVMEIDTLPGHENNGGGGGNGGFSTGDLFALAAKKGVSKMDAGLAFERAMLDYLGLESNKTKFKSKARMLKTGGKYSNVIPDAVSNIKVFSLFGEGYYPNSYFHEAKAVTGWLNLISGSSDYQVLGLIDAVATSTLGGKDGRSILTFYTTSNTYISPEVIQYANQKNVTLKWSVAYMHNNLLYFTDPTTLSYAAKRQTIKIPFGAPQNPGVEIKF